MVPIFAERRRANGPKHSLSLFQMRQCEEAQNLKKKLSKRMVEGGVNETMNIVMDDKSIEAIELW